MITVNSFFSGGGLLDLGLSLGGLCVQQSFELDPVCCATLRANFNHRVVACDIGAKLVKDELPSDVMSFTYPCTHYAEIADIHGTRTGDEYFLHSFRHMAIKQPELYVIENVPGMRKFPVVMEAMTTLPGYYVTSFCPISSQTWLPQNRDRLIIIGSKKNFSWRPPKVRRRVALAEILEPDPKVKIPPYVYKRLRGGYRDMPIISDPERGDIAPTCVAHYSKDRSTRLVKDRRFRHGVRPYTVREYARLQGVPDTFTFAGTNTDAYRMIGNGVSVPVGEWLAREIKRYFKR